MGGGGNSAQDFLWGEALSHSAPGTPRGRDSDSGAQARWGHPAPMAKVRERVPPPTSPPVPCGPTSSMGEGASFLSPVSPHKPCCLCVGPHGPVAALCPPPPGPSVGWDGSVETLAEREADANREGEWGPGKEGR